MNHRPECRVGTRRAATVLRRVMAIALATSGAAALAIVPPKPETVAVPQPTTWAWRQLVEQQVEMKVAPPAAAPERTPQLSPLLLHAAPDTEVITMAPFRVNGARVTNELRQLYARQEKQAKEDLIMRRLGIGAHVIGYKHFGAGVVTVFYIPVFAGFGFSW